MNIVSQGVLYASADTLHTVRFYFRKEKEMELLGILILVAVTFSGGFVMGYLECKCAKDRELELETGKAMAEGYRIGYQTGYQKAVSEKVTPNMLRAYLGLDPLSEQNRRADDEA